MFFLIIYIADIGYILSKRYLLHFKGISLVITHKQMGSDIYMHLSLPMLQTRGLGLVAGWLLRTPEGKGASDLGRLASASLWLHSVRPDQGLRG